MARFRLKRRDGKNGSKKTNGNGHHNGNGEQVLKGNGNGHKKLKADVPDQQDKGPFMRIVTLGRPDYRNGEGKYKPEYANVAHDMCKLGATQFELAQHFGVRDMTIKEWAHNDPNFAAALKEGKQAFDYRIERSLAERALGYTYMAEKIMVVKDNIVRVPIAVHVPPDPTSCFFWLQNRNRADWRNVQRIEHTGEGGEPIKLSVDELKKLVMQRLAEMRPRIVEPMPDGPSRPNPKIVDHEPR